MFGGFQEVMGVANIGGFGVCVWQEGRDRRHGNGGRDVIIDKGWKFILVCVCVCLSTWTDLLCSGVTSDCQGCMCVREIHPAAHHLTSSLVRADGSVGHGGPEGKERLLAEHNPYI